MTRNIVCPGCIEERRELFKSGEPYPGEFVKLIKGAALDEYVCDYCNKNIYIGEKCIALSIHTKRTPYYRWESDYIEVKEKNET